MRLGLLTIAVFLYGISAEAADRRKLEAAFPPKLDGMTLVGTSVRTKTILRFKVYAVGYYLADSAVPALCRWRAAGNPSAVYEKLLRGESEQAIVLRALRDLSAADVRAAFESRLAKAVDAEARRRFLSYLDGARKGESCVLRRRANGTLEVTVAGVQKPPILRPDFTRDVFALWLGPRRKRDLLSPDDALCAPVQGGGAFPR